MAKCAICDKKTSFGNQLSITRSHISKRTSRPVKPNLRNVKAIINGEPKKITVCAKCLRSGKVTRAN
jgi:large subunit ribosomal protein L28